MILLTLVLTGYLALGSPSPVTDSVINVNDYGVYGDGITQQADTLQHILDTYSHIYFPAGKYLVNKCLTLRSNHHISGTDSTVFVFSEKTDSTSSFSFFTITGARNILMERLTFYAQDQPARTAFALVAHNVHHLTLDQVEAYHCGVAQVLGRNAGSHTYASIPDDLSGEAFRQVGSSHITITQCHGKGSTRGVAEHTAGVLIAYTNHWKVTHSSFSRYSHGIQWWGGDSNTGRDGRLYNARKCKNGTVAEVEVSHVRGGGIWGSMGENITVQNCRVTHCGDVGIDFEGCFSAQAINNYVAESNNGNLATFHHNKDIRFASNQVVQSNAKRIQACIYNASQSRDNGQVTFDDNVFITTQGVGLIKQQGPSSHIIFTNNSLHNVVANFSFNNNHQVLIRENTFHITRSLAGYDYVIKAGQTHFGGEVVIENNQILTTVAQPGNAYAISLHQSDYNSSPVNRVIDNYVAGLPHQVRTEWVGSNAGCRAKTYIHSKQALSPEAVKKVDTGARASELYVNDKQWR